MRTEGRDEALAVGGLDPQMARVVEAMGDAPNIDLDSLPVEEALRLVRVLPNSPPPGNTEDRLIDACKGQQIRLRLYFPEGVSKGLPVLMHLHGGGFVTGTIEMDDGRCSRLAQQAQCIVASVDYPLAPEHPFPEPIEGAFAVWRWLTASASEFGGDPTRMAVSGSSAGGHLAIGVCILARDRKALMPLLQLLSYPVVDPSLATGSYEQFANGPFLTLARMAWFWKQYAAGSQPKGHLWDPSSGPLAGLPPAHVITAEFDVLRDEAEMYVESLRGAGVSATHSRHAGMLHGFIAIAPDHVETANAINESAAVLRDVFSRERP